MGDVQVKRATVVGTRVERLVVGMEHLADRAIDREVAIRWMRDGHSLIPILDGARGPALQLVEVGDGWAIRTDNQQLDEDRLPPLPDV